MLSRIPVSMPYNVTLLEVGGRACTVAICPGEAPEVLSMAFATNHQLGSTGEDLAALADSCQRERYLSSLVAGRAGSVQQMREAFLQPPLLRRASEWRGWGTLYGSSYEPGSGAVDLFWPGKSLRQSFKDFTEAQIEVTSPAFDWQA